ncbi:MAG: hypothetical protein ACU88J_12555, partial [Gammaproteobacteria bacterium]
EDRETHLLQDDTTIVNQNRKTIIEQDLAETIKGEALRYTEKDERRRFLENLYQNTAKAMGIEVKGAYGLEADSIKKTAAGKIDFEGASGISLKCGGNVLTVDGSGIHFKTPNFDANSGNGGVSAAEVLDEDVIVNVRITNSDDTYVRLLADDTLHIKADTSLKDGRSVDVSLMALDKNEKILATETRSATVQTSEIDVPFEIDSFIEKYSLEIESIAAYAGEVTCQ